ncbi:MULTISPECIES: GNAT family N-acetyltransferase [unclassified Ruegeria]|uniref:GNAT family N-acetyltransferase n=1 Tax=unclassified Ruegeria TaxID=2625375 RepID=UPI001489EE3E|nr:MULTISPECIES: GNAT family N-acetyltransferase [unclassified Ruegeria]NOD36344.1 GNAT family N-acetyltransferase [Ruegeria sp. HKCCD7296]NOE42453.1 GNAT family N-acetyltransferase [Ruegeria sp. HKCCD7319]
MTSFTIPTIETERLILRAPHLDDLPAMTAFFATKRSHMVGGPKDELGSWDSLVKRLGHWALKGFGLWHLTEKSSGAFVGWAGMIDAPGWAEPELGWTLMAEAEGKGLGFEAAQAARDYAARQQGLNGVISYIAHANDRSRALAERLGATLELENAELLGKRAQIWRHPQIDLTTERTGQ